MSDNRHTLYGADGRYESTNRMPEPKLPGDRVEGPEGSLVWDGHVWIVDDLCEYDDCQNQATHTESWYDEEGVDARVCDEHE